MSWSETPAPRAARRAWLRALAGGALPLLLGACGFHLRGTTDLPFARMVVQGQPGAMLDLLKRTLLVTTHTRLVSDPRQAQAVLTLLQETASQTPTAYNADGTVAQYTLHEVARFQLTAPDGRVYIGPTTISRSSRLSYSSAAALGKAEEADMLYAGMRQSLVDRIVFQLGNFHPPAAAPDEQPAS